MRKRQLQERVRVLEEDLKQARNERMMAEARTAWAEGMIDEWRTRAEAAEANAQPLTPGEQRLVNDVLAIELPCEYNILQHDALAATDGMSVEEHIAWQDAENPKDALGIRKAPLDLVPPALGIATAPAMANGAGKYGPYNWRTKRVKSSVYYAAALRHLQAWWDGENFATDSGAPHLGHVAACMAILIDAEAAGSLNDDRPTPGPAAEMLHALDKSREA